MPAVGQRAFGSTHSRKAGPGLVLTESRFHSNPLQQGPDGPAKLAQAHEQVANGAWHSRYRATWGRELDPLSCGPSLKCWKHTYVYIYIYIYIIEGSLEVKLPTIWTVGKSRGGKSQSQRGEEKKWEDQRGEKVRRKKMQVHDKVGSQDSQCFSNDL